MKAMKSNEGQRCELLRGMASAASLGGLIVGVPLLLAFGVGWPLPQGVPSGSEVLTAFKTGAISPSMILKPLSLVVWVLWLQMAIGVGIELWAHLSGGVAPRVRVIPLFMQRLSARLMGTALVIALSVQHPGTALGDNKELLDPPALEVDISPAQAVASYDVRHPTSSERPRSNPEETDYIDPKLLLHTVERRDSLRMLAEQYLGDPNRWTEVFVLNRGQAQADGGSLTDPARLRPGWQLVMPADAQLPSAGAPSIDQTSDRGEQPDAFLGESAFTARENPPGEPEHLTVTVQEGDTLWGLAEHHLQEPERWVEIFDSNQDIIQDPDLILPGWHLQVPNNGSGPAVVHPPTQPFPEPDDAPVSDRRSRAAPTDWAAPEIRPLGESNRSTASETHLFAERGRPAEAVAAFATATPTVVANVAEPVADHRPAPGTQAILAVGGLGVFVSSLGWVLARLRKSQRRQLPSGRIPVSLSKDAAQVDQQLQAAADPDRALFLDASLRVMAARIAGRTPPEVLGVALGPESVAVHLSFPVEAPSGFHSSNNEMTWTLRRDTELEDLLAEADGVAAPLPALAAFGTSDGRECLLNLEHMAAVSLTGDSEAIADLCTAIATQLASSHLADELTVICVGFGQDLTVFERVEHVPDVAAAIERIEYHQRENQALLGRPPCLAASRIGADGNSWPPTVVLAPNRLAKEEAAHFLSASGSSVCVVAHGLEGARWSGHFDEDGLRLQPVGLRLQAHRMSGTAAAAVAQLASTAEHTEETAPIRSPPPRLQYDSAAAVPFAPNNEHPLGQSLEVRVLGPVELVGGGQPLASRRALDLVAFLAFHPEGADRDQLKAQLWPLDHPPSDSTLANTVSRARKALGVDSNNKPYFPRASSNGIYRLQAGIETDVDRFTALVCAARSEPGEQGRRHLQAALDLVRGTPFTGGGGDMYRWADFGLRTEIECLVDAAAHELASRCIDAGDSPGAARAAMISLRLVGLCEQCYRWRLLAAADNPTEIRKIMGELDNLLKRENPQVGADNLVGTDLLALGEKLLSSGVTVGEAAGTAPRR